MALFDILKNIFLILILLQIAPMVYKNIAKEVQSYTEPKTAIGVVCIEEVLYDSQDCVEQISTLMKKNDVKGILIKIDCAGSASGTAQAVVNEITALKKEYNKPMVVLVENICTSGGYWIASACDYIITPATALVGSIGAIFPYLFQLKESLAQLKIGYVSIKAGAYKSATDPFAALTPEQEKMLQSVLDDTYAHFTQSVAQHRKLSLENVNQWADGQLFSGAQALKLGLIDELGSLQTAVRILKERALIEGEIEWVNIYKERTLLEKLWGQNHGFCKTIMEKIASCMMEQSQKSFV